MQCASQIPLSCLLAYLVSPPSSAPEDTHRSLACSFYGLHPVLIPHRSSAEVLVQHIGKVQPEVLIAEAGTIGFQPVLSACNNLSHVIWLTRPGNEHMDFALSAESGEGKVESLTWHDLVEEHKQPSDSQIPTIEKGSHSLGLSILESTSNATTVVEYGSKVNSYIWPCYLSNGDLEYRCCCRWPNAYPFSESGDR